MCASAEEKALAIHLALTVAVVTSIEIFSRQDEGKEATVVFESLICLEYIDECCGDPTVQLFPGAAPQRARQRMAINFVEKKVVVRSNTLH